MATMPLLPLRETTGPVSAELIEVGRDGSAVVRIDDGGMAREIPARLALPVPRSLDPGDEVLVLEGDEAFVIGVLRAQAPSRVYDKRGELLFEYDAAQDVARLRVGASGLVVDSDGAPMEFRSEGMIRMDCSSLVVEHREGANPSTNRLEVGDAGLRYRGRGLDVEAENGALRVEDLAIEGQHLEVRHGRVELFARKARSVVDDLVERFKNVCRRVEGTEETRAGRVRTMVDEEHELRADRVRVGAERDVKINGEKIHLG